MSDHKDTSAFFTSHQSRDVPRDRYGRYELPDPYTGEEVDGWTRATTFAATLAESYGLRIWKERQVVWGLSRRPDLITLASTISGPEDKKALGAIVTDAHIAAGTDAKANRGTAIHRACQAAERKAYHEVPEELRKHVAGYFAEMKRHRLQVIPEYVERVVVVPRYHVAGQLDNLVLCPDGKIRVCDKKTGNLDYADIEFQVQLALYANATHMFNYGTMSYEQMPEIATDYAIIMHIDPETGATEGQRVNIGWGWAWARTCAEVMDIRKTKHGITPLVPPTDVLAETSHAIGAMIVDRTISPLGSDATAIGSRIVESVGPAFGGMITAQLVPTGNPEPSADAAARIETLPDASISYELSGVPGGHVNALIDVAPEYQAFWSDSRHFEESEEDLTMHGVPLADYGKPTTWPCARNEPCEFTGSEGLHPDGTVCAYGNARPGPVPITPTSVLAVAANSGAMPINAEMIAEAHARRVPIDAQGQPTAGSMAVADREPTEEELTRQNMSPAERAEQLSNVDVIMSALMALKDKAAMQTVARRLMDKIGKPDAIALKKYKVDIARQIVSVAFNHGASIPGLDDSKPDFGIPTGPAPLDDSTGKKAAGAAGTEVTEQDKRQSQVRAALIAISTAASVSALQAVHKHYSARPEIGWTEEMQQAAQARAAELDSAAGQSTLTPLEQIEGATSKDTIAKVWSLVTDNGANKAGWTPDLNAAAIRRNAELNGVTQPVAPSGNE